GGLAVRRRGAGRHAVDAVRPTRVAGGQGEAVGMALSRHAATVRRRRRDATPFALRRTPPRLGHNAPEPSRAGNANQAQVLGWTPGRWGAGSESRAPRRSGLRHTRAMADVHHPGASLPPEPTADHEARVTPLELFFDLVFVFGLTQITGAVVHDPTAVGIGRA